MLPLPLNFNIASSWIPLGIVIYYCVDTDKEPEPEQGLHGDVIFEPYPPQLWH